MLRLASNDVLTLVLFPPPAPLPPAPLAFVVILSLLRLASNDVVILLLFPPPTLLIPCAARVCNVSLSS